MRPNVRAKRPARVSVPVSCVQAAARSHRGRSKSNTRARTVPAFDRWYQRNRDAKKASNGALYSSSQECASTLRAPPSSMNGASSG